VGVKISLFSYYGGSLLVVFFRYRGMFQGSLFFVGFRYHWQSASSSFFVLYHGGVTRGISVSLVIGVAERSFFFCGVNHNT